MSFKLSERHAHILSVTMATSSVVTPSPCHCVFDSLIVKGKISIHTAAFVNSGKRIQFYRPERET